MVVMETANLESRRPASVRLATFGAQHRTVDLVLPFFADTPFEVGMSLVKKLVRPTVSREN